MQAKFHCLSGCVDLNWTSLLLGGVGSRERERVERSRDWVDWCSRDCSMERCCCVCDDPSVS